VAIAILVMGNVVAAGIDLRTRRVPNVLTMGMAIAGIAIAAAGDGRVGVLAALGGCALGAALMMPGHIFGATGAGDVKLLAASGTLLGPSLTLRAFVATAIAGGLLAVVVAVRRGRLRTTLEATRRLATRDADAQEIEQQGGANKFAYAPAIAAGVITALVWGLGN
jgi:prepilin peptidase CpaA